MPAFNEPDRARAFGSYTGCPCSIKLDSSVTSTDRSISLVEFNRMVDDLISQWHNACDKYQPGLTIGAMISENRDKEKNLRYGRVARIPCVFNESAPRGISYCKFSLKDIGR